MFKVSGLGYIGLLYGFCKVYRPSIRLLNNGNYTSEKCPRLGSQGFPHASLKRTALVGGAPYSACLGVLGVFGAPYWV